MKSFFWLILELLLIAALFNACFPKEYKNAHPEFIHGGLTEDGKYDFDAKNTIVTKNTIACTKFRIDRDFDADYKVRIFYYDDEEVVVKIQELSGSSLNVDYVDMPDDAVSIRLEISNFAGFTNWDRFAYRWWNSGLEISTKKQSIWGSIWDKLNFVKKFNELGDAIDRHSSGEKDPWSYDVNVMFRKGYINPLFQDPMSDVQALEHSVYTKDLIECSSFRLRFEPDDLYECRVYYFTEDDELITYEKVSSNTTLFVTGDNMPILTRADGTQAAAAGIRISLIRTDLVPISAGTILFLDDYLTLDICNVPDVASALQAVAAAAA